MGVALGVVPFAFEGSHWGANTQEASPDWGSLARAPGLLVGLLRAFGLGAGFVIVGMAVCLFVGGDGGKRRAPLLPA